MCMMSRASSLSLSGMQMRGKGDQKSDLYLTLHCVEVLLRNVRIRRFLIPVETYPSEGKDGKLEERCCAGEQQALQHGFESPTPVLCQSGSFLYLPSTGAQLPLTPA
jgi:hypothetical protein